MFLLKRPDKAAIDAFRSGAQTLAISYPDIGLTKHTTASHEGPFSDSYKIDHNRIAIGTGDADWEKAKEAVRSWKMFDLPWVELCWPDTPIKVGNDVAILVVHLGFYSLNAARIVYVIDEPGRFGFAYGTLTDHGESGEERFLVELDPESGDVFYDLLAVSRPGHFLTYLGYPFARLLQKRFAADSKAAMLTAVAS
jgi:uncharacterized protein (UPF0548 family)